MRLCKAWGNQHKRHPSPFPHVRPPVRFVPGDTVHDVTDEALALTIPCPKTACAAFCGERCVSFATGRALDVPHDERIQEALADRPNLDATAGS